MLGPFTTASRLTPIHQMSLAVLSRAACASMSTTTTTTRDRGDRYGPMEWAQWRPLLNSRQRRKFTITLCAASPLSPNPIIQVKAVTRGCTDHCSTKEEPLCIVFVSFWYMTSAFEFDTQDEPVRQNLGQRSFSSNVIAWTETHTNTHRSTALPGPLNWSLTNRKTTIWNYWRVWLFAYLKPFDTWDQITNIKGMLNANTVI